MCIHTHTREQRGGKKKTQNPNGIIFWRAGPLGSPDFPCWVSVLGTHLCQCTSWCCCERLCLASMNVFVVIVISTCLPISWWVIYEGTCQHCVECSAVFDQRQHVPHSPPSFFTRSNPEQSSFPPPDEKSPQRETFCQCGRGEPRNGISAKRHQNQRVQKLFWAVEKKVSVGVLHQMESTLKVTEV